MPLQDEHIRLLLDGLDALRVGVVIVDAGETLIYCNQHYKYIYRASGDPADFLGQPIENLLRLHREKNEIAEPHPDEWITRRMEHHRSGARFPFDEKLNDGRWIQVRARPLPNRDGTIFLLTDASETKTQQEKISLNESRITNTICEVERKNQELEEKRKNIIEMSEDLHLAKQEAQRATGARNIFFHNMNHQLRTPLNAIIGFADMMRAEMLGPLGKDRYREYADDIFQSGSYLLSLINQILDYAQVGSSAYRLNLAIHPVHKLINTCVRGVAETAAHADIGIEVMGDLEALPHVHVDEIAAGQVVVNLLLQAIRSSPRGGTIALSVWAEDNHVMFSICDRGKGMSETEIRQLDIMPADEALAGIKDHADIEISLPLSKALVGMHGGHFRIHSDQGCGTTVTFSFPQYAGETAEIAGA